MIVTIDGPAASGKSTVAKALASRLGLHYLDTGAMYRAVALKALRLGIPLDDEEALGRLAEESRIRFEHEGGEPLPTAVVLDGEDVSRAIRSPAVDDAVSAVSRVPEVRHAMVGQQREMAATEDIVAEGRDVGTVVFPDAQVKVFLSASAEERARRRHDELLEAGHEVTADGVLGGLARRDEADSRRQASPLRAAPDAVVIDTTGLSREEVLQRVVRLVHEAEGG